MAVFISYARKDRQAAEILRADLERAKRPVWLDAELTGGQVWWDTILGAIRTSDVFLVALSPDWLKSRACASEYRYAVACGRPVLAVMVAEVKPQLAPPEIANSQILDYRERTADSAIALVTALAMQPIPPAAPSPPPEPPPVPMSYLSSFREQVEASSLSYEQQHQLLFALRGQLEDEDDEQRETVLELLRHFRRRRDIVESIGRDVDALLAGLPATAAATTAAAATAAAEAPAGPAAAWFPDPLGRFEQRYWDGTAWTATVASGGRPSVDPLGASRAPVAQSRPQPPSQPQPFAHPTPQPGGGPSVSMPPVAGAAVAPSAGSPPAWETGTYVALIIASLLCAGIVGVIVGATNLKHEARKSQATTLLVVGSVVLVLAVLFSLASASTTNSEF
jgi:TIR domain/Protein of unknown function (DUF2510)